MKKLLFGLALAMLAAPIRILGRRMEVTAMTTRPASTAAMSSGSPFTFDVAGGGHELQ